MLVAAAVCPCPPLLVPEVAAGAAPELDPARAACADALGVLAAARPDRLVVVGPADRTDAGPCAQGTPGSFRGFGVDVGVRLGGTPGTPETSGRPRAVVAEGPGGSAPSGASAGAGGVAGPAGEARALPPSLAVGAWLLEHTRWAAAPVEGLAVDAETSPEEAARTGRELSGRAERLALLVMGDASACRTVKAPGYLDERAEPFDAEVARALGDADPGALLALDAGLAAELQASGRAPWQLLAGAAEDAGLTGRLLYDEAPYGVGYLVAVWS
jgi:hypothetical protein